MRFNSSLIEQFFNLARSILPCQCELIFRLVAELVDLFQICFGAHSQNLFNVRVGEALSISYQVQ